MPEIKIIERPLASLSDRWTCAIIDVDGTEHLGKGRTQSEALMIASAAWYLHNTPKRK